MQNTQIREANRAWLSFLADHQSPSPTKVAGVPGTRPGWQLVTRPRHSPLAALLCTHCPRLLDMEGVWRVPRE